MNKKKTIYLDYAASTPVDPRVLRVMLPYFSERFGNPGSLHSFGQEAIAAVDVSRETIAKAIGADFREVIFTSSATEANNLALRGAVREFTQIRSGSTQMSGENPRVISDHPQPRIIVSVIEHESILETARELGKEGIDVVYLPVDRHGVVDLKMLKASLTEETVLVSIMHANNEIGVIQPISEVSKIIQEFRAGKAKQLPGKSMPHAPYPIPFLHSDCSQSFQFLDCTVKNLGVDLMTLSAHKIYGPKGAGALYVRKSAQSAKGKGQNGGRMAISASRLAPLLSGGGQEFGLRSGTENVPAIVGFAKAVKLITFSRSQERENVRIENLRDQLWKGIKKICPGAEMNGKWQMAPRRGSGQANDAEMLKNHVPFAPCHLPNILNVYFPNHDAQDLLTRFDLHGLAVSSGSACRSRAMESSHVIQALGHSKERANSSIRFSFGRPTIKAEINGALKVLDIRCRT